MNLGRYHQGRQIMLPLHLSKPNGTAAAADLLPAVTIHNTAGTRLLSDLMPRLDRYKATDLYGYLLFLDDDFPAGRYLVSFRWKSSAVGRLKTAVFEVVAGGDSTGSAVSLYSLERPHAKHLVQRTDAGKRYHRRNPYL